MSKWAYIENIVIYIVIGLLVYITKTWWSLFLLIFVNSNGGYKIKSRVINGIEEKKHD